MYTNLKNVQILISLLKQYGIKYFVNSPGTRNTPLVHSIEEDPFFKCYSIVDERSAAYFALGLSEALDAPVCVTCTAATATCNYMPAIKEAYERNIQLVALTADRDLYKMFNMEDQLINQMDMYKGYVKYSVDIPDIKDGNDKWYANRCINEAFLELNHNGKGPIQVNYRVLELGEFKCQEVPKARKIDRLDRENVNWEDVKSKLSKKNRIMVFCGSNYNSDNNVLKEKILEFHKEYNSVIFIDHYSNVTSNDFLYSTDISESITGDEVRKMLPDLIITFGNVIYSPIKFRFNGIQHNFEHWHISEQGVVNDGFRNLTNLFEFRAIDFFENTVGTKGKNNGTYCEMWKKRINETKHHEMKFTNFTAIRDLVKNIPNESTVHMSVLDSIRISNYFRFNNKNIKCFANIGADGIDGALSTFLGHAGQTDKLAFLIIGDLSYIYDMNGSLNIKDKNVRIMVVNNYAGAEFHKNFGLKLIPTLNLHIAAGHKTKIEECSKVSNVQYLSASNQEELDKAMKKFTSENDKPIILEVFTDAKTDADNLKEFWKVNTKLTGKGRVKNIIKKLLGENGKKYVKKLLGKE